MRRSGRLASLRQFCHIPPLHRTARPIGLPWLFNLHPPRPVSGLPVPVRAKEMKMPKMKTKSGAKKRFKITGTGKVVYAQRGKRHGMIKRTNKQIRQLRGTNILFKTDGENVKKYWMPNG
jgi:large subunit ribosomal protein L35